MSAAPCPLVPLSPCLPSAPPQPRGSRWLPLDEAARLLDVVPGHVARDCRAKYAERGLAKLEAPAEGGKPQWFVRTDAHPLLNHAPAPEHLPFDASQITAEQRKEVEARLAIVLEWERRLDAGQTLKQTGAKVTADFIDHVLIDQNRRLSQRTLYNWHRDYRANGKAGLVDQRWMAGGANKRDPQDPFVQELARWWLDQNQPSVAVCYKLACAVADRSGWAKPSYRVACRELSKLPRAKVIKARLGNEAHNNLCNPYHERDYTSLSSNQIWCGDHHPCDVMVMHKGKIVRPWLTVWQDMRSRKITGVSIYAHDPNRNAIILAFKLGAGVNGLPEFVYVDNGKDYDCYALQGFTKLERRTLKVTNQTPTLGGIFGDLSVQVLHAPPYHPQSKPVERFFGTFEGQFGKLQPTYCGNTPDAKPERLAKLLNDGGRLGGVPTLEEYAAAALDWIANVYNEQPHTGQGMDRLLPEDQAGPQLTPTEVFDRCFHKSKRAVTRQELDLYCTEPSRPVKVGRNGVRLGSRTYGRGEPLLMNEWLSKQVVLRVDPCDVTHGHVWTPQGKLICAVKLNGLTPFMASDEEFRKAHRQLQHARKVQKQAIETRHLRLVADPAELIYENRLAEQKERQKKLQLDAPDPVNVKPLQGPLTDGFKQLQSQQEKQKLLLASEPTPDPFADLSAASSRDDDDTDDVPADPFASLTAALGFSKGDDE